MTRRRLPSEPPAPARPPGYYTELMRRWNWPPRFESRMPGPDTVDSLRHLAREQRAPRGVGGFGEDRMTGGAA